MPFYQAQKRIIENTGVSAFDRALKFDEIATLETAQSEFKRALGFSPIHIIKVEDASEEDKRAADNSAPGNPSFSFKNE